MIGGGLLLLDGAERVAGARDVGEIDLGFEFFFAVLGGAGGPGGCGRGVAAGTNIFAHQFGFVVFERTGVRFLFGNADGREGVKNFPALDFQLPGQIIDSNLHPFSLSFSSRQLEYYVRISNLSESRNS
jgi:hypothetical protein